MSIVTPAASAAAEAASLFDPRQVDAQLEAQLGARRPSDSDSSARCEGWRAWLLWLLLLPLDLVMTLVLRPVAAAVAGTVAFIKETPAVIPAVVAMLFLYIALPLLIAWDIV